MKKNRLIAIVLVVIMSLSVLTSCSHPWDEKESESGTEQESEIVTEPVTEEEPDPTENPGYNPLTGLTDLPDGTKNERPIAIVVSNIDKARPQWGVSTADICMEGLAEGGISRMLCFYADSSSIPKIGPIRSARHDFIEMALGFDAVFTHCGQSPLAQDYFSKYSMDNVNGLYYDGTLFKRDPERRKRGLEHSMYIDSELLASAMENEKTRTELDTAYSNILTFAGRGNPTLPADGWCDEIEFSFSNYKSYSHKMVYNPLTLRYTKYQGSEVMTDANTDKEVSYVNVLLLYTGISTMDSYGRVDMNLSGGAGVYVSKGKYETIKWEKGDARSTLKLYRQDGTELPLNLGNSYIGFVPSSREGKTVITGSAPVTNTSSSAS